MSGYKQGNPTPPLWRPVTLAEALTPDANGASFDPQGLLSGAITEVSPGRFQFPVSGGALQTNPDQGAGIIWYPKNDAGQAVGDTPPRGMGIEITFHTPPADSSGVVIVVGASPKSDLADNFSAGGSWDVAGVRARAGYRALLTTGTTETTTVGCMLTMLLRPCPDTVPTGLVDFANVYANTLESDGQRNNQVNRAVNDQLFAGDDMCMFVSVFSATGSISAVTPEFSVSYFYDTSPRSYL